MNFKMEIRKDLVDDDQLISFKFKKKLSNTHFQNTLPSTKTRLENLNGNECKFNKTGECESSMMDII